MKPNPLFIETIKLQAGKLLNLEFHNARTNTARREVLDIEMPLDLMDHITVPTHLGRGVYKCRVTFGKTIENVSIEKYRRKNIRSLKLVDGGDIDYRYKYADRSVINALFEQRGICDDILIVKNGYITDTSYANVAFYDDVKWYTPAKPLLAGTKRAQLFMDGKITEAMIQPSDLSQFSQIMVFNAMMEFDPRRTVPLSGIFR